MDREKYSVVVVDPQPIVVEGVQALLGRASDLEFAGAADSVESAQQRFREPYPSALLLDKSYGAEKVLECLRELRGVEVVAWGASMSAAEAARFVRAGAKGVLSKTAETSELLTCLRSVVAGQSWYPEELFKGFHLGQPVSGAALTKREQQVLELVAAGRKNREIAAELGIRLGTLKVHLRRIFKKTGVRSRYGFSLGTNQRSMKA